jgi:hypothetical protein
MKRFVEARQAIEAEETALIDHIDASSSGTVLAEVNKSINSAARSVTTLAAKRMAALAVEAEARVLSSVAHLVEIAGALGGLRTELTALLAAGDLHPLLALCCIGAAITAFFTELALTNSLTFLLNFRADDPTARAMGAAFAASLLVFEIVFEKLRLIQDPWPLFRRSEDRGSDSKTWRNLWQSLRAGAGVVLVLALLGIAVLQAGTIVKMAPTREIAGKLRIDKTAKLLPAEEQEVKNSVLFFSVCVLVSGGFLAAVGKREFGLWSRHLRLERRIKKLAAEEKTLADHLSREEMPVLAAELAAAGLPFMWLPTVPLAEISRELVKMRNLLGGATRTIATAADNEAAVFAAAQRVALGIACAKEPPSPPRRSTVEIVDDTISAAAAAPAAGQGSLPDRLIQPDGDRPFVESRAVQPQVAMS